MGEGRGVKGLSSDETKLIIIQPPTMMVLNELDIEDYDIKCYNNTDYIWKSWYIISI